MNSLVEDLNKEPEDSIVPIAVEETRGHLRALPLSGDSHFNIILILLKNMRETVEIFMAGKFAQTRKNKFWFPEFI